MILRFAISILLGTVFPILYVVIVESFCELIFPQYHLDTMQVYGQASMGFILAPIAIPFWIYDFIRFHHYLGLSIFFDTVWFRWLWIVGFNIFFYTGLSYILLGYFGFFKTSEQSNFQEPPLPPQF